MRLVLAITILLLGSLSPAANARFCYWDMVGDENPSEMISTHVVHGLEVMDAPETQLQQQREIYQKLESEGKFPRQGFGMLPSGRAGKYWGTIALSNDISLELAGTPRMVKGRLWVPATFDSKDPVLSYVSVDSLFRLYGDRFFSEVIDPKLTYLAPVEALQRHVFELVQIIKFEGDNLLVRDRNGRTKRMSKFDFFASNISVLHWEFLVTLDLGSMRDFYQLGGRGEIFLSELGTSPQHGTEIGFEGFYIRVTQLPEFSFSLFHDKAVHESIRANFDSTPILYTISTFFAGVSIPKDDSLIVNMANRLKLKKKTPFIGITPNTEAPVFVHEKTHANDDLDPKLSAFGVKVLDLEAKKQLPEDAYRVVHLAITEKRAYAAEIKKRNEGLGQSKNSDDNIQRRNKQSRSDYSLHYLEPFVEMIGQLKKTNPALAKFLIEQANELCEGSDIVAAPFVI